jgi:DNA-binding transcriptional LysR family regulator
MAAPRLSWNARPLRALEAIARLRSVSAAARELGYTQSAASQQLAALEREAGVSLVDRGARPLRLTEAGEIVLRHARDVLAGFVAMESALDELHGLRAGRLRLAAFASALATFLPPAVAELVRRHPDVAVEVTVAEPPAAVAALRAGAVDLAVLHRMGAAPDEGGLRRRPLLDDDLYVVLPEDHPLAALDAVGLADLAGVPMVAPRRDRAAGAHRALVERLMAGAGVEPRVAYEVDDLPAAQALARAGLAAVLMHGLTIPAAHPGIAVRPLRGVVAGARAVEVATLAGRRWPPADAMADLLVERLRDAARGSARDAGGG